MIDSPQLSQQRVSPQLIVFDTRKSRNLPNLANPAYAISRAADLQTLETKRNIIF
jgi:hypothetical protein